MPRLREIEQEMFYFFFGFEAGFAGLEGVVFLAVVGFEARCFFSGEGLALVEVVFFEAVFTVADLTDLASGSVLRADEAGTSSAGIAGKFLAASRQLGKKSSMRWREIELARRQRGQWASKWFWCFSSMLMSAESISARLRVKGV